jgi:hypothetical protein
VAWLVNDEGEASERREEGASDAGDNLKEEEDADDDAVGILDGEGSVFM